MSDDLVERYSRSHMSQQDVSTLLRRFHEATAEIARLRAEVALCHARLETDRVFVMGDGDETIRKEVPEDERLSVPDGIDARDATIRGLEERCARLRALNAELVEALRPFVRIPPIGTFGGPLVGACALYEDGSDEKHRPPNSVIGHEPFRAARAALAKAEGREP